jgi:hypothetical protein
MAIGSDGKLHVTNFGTTAGQGQVLSVALPGPDAAAGFTGLPTTSNADGTGRDTDGGVLGSVGDLLN